MAVTIKLKGSTGGGASAVAIKGGLTQTVYEFIRQNGELVYEADSQAVLDDLYAQSKSPITKNRFEVVINGRGFDKDEPVPDPVDCVDFTKLNKASLRALCADVGIVTRPADTTVSMSRLLEAYHRGRKDGGR